MKYGNCLIFALYLWFKNGTAHSYLIIRKSRFTWVPHIMWTKSIDSVYIKEYKPISATQRRLARWFPFITLLFRGRIREGVGEEHPIVENNKLAE